MKLSTHHGLSSYQYVSWSVRCISSFFTENLTPDTDSIWSDGGEGANRSGMRMLLDGRPERDTGQHVQVNKLARKRL